MPMGYLCAYCQQPRALTLATAILHDYLHGEIHLVDKPYLAAGECGGISPNGLDRLHDLIFRGTGLICPTT